MAKEKVQTAQQKFEAYVRLDEFMGNVDPKGILKDTASGAKGIVSTGDLQKLYENFPGSRLLAVKVPDHELIKLLRLVKEGTDKEVFAEADIRFEKVHVPTVHSIQTFVNIKRLSDTPRASRFLSPLGLDLNQGGAFMITIENENGKYASILLPPLVTNYKKNYFEEPLSNLEKMISSGYTLTVKGLAGDTVLNLPALLSSFKEEMTGPSSTIPVVLDGTHRAYVCYLANVPMNAIVIYGDDAPRNIPVKFDDVALVLERPANSEERYLGVVRAKPKLNLADLGIGQNR